MNETFLTLFIILGALAVHRLSLMGSSEEGPASIFARMRRQVPRKTNPGRGIRCFKCWSVWISAVITLYYQFVGACAWQLTPIIWMAMSSLAICIHSKFTADK